MESSLPHYIQFLTRNGHLKPPLISSYGAHTYTLLRLLEFEKNTFHYRMYLIAGKEQPNLKAVCYSRDTPSIIVVKGYSIGLTPQKLTEYKMAGKIQPEVPALNTSERISEMK